MRAAVGLALVAMACTQPHVTRPIADVPTNHRVIDITGYTTLDGVHHACAGTATVDAAQLALECDGQTKFHRKAELRSLDIARGRPRGESVFYVVVAGVLAIAVGVVIVLATADVSGG